MAVKKKAADVKEKPDPKGSKGKKDKKTDGKNDGDANKPTRGIAIGDNFGWTGKLPMTLLYEYCQKQKWLKPTFETRPNKDGVLTIITLQWENPKTKELIKIKYNPKISKPTANESRHTAATYTMFRINYKKNLKMVLPVIFRSYWDELETERKNTDKAVHDLIYSETPFQSYLDNRKLKEEREREKEKQNTRDDRPRDNIKHLNLNHTTYSKAVWDNSPVFDIKPEVRIELENNLKLYPWPIEETQPDQPPQYADTLAQLGFKPRHITECLKYTNEFNESLEWLIFYLPEDELPDSFNKTGYNSNMRITVGKTYPGFTTTEVKRLLDQNWTHDAAIIKLTQSLINNPVPHDGDYDESLDSWQEEVDSLISMGYNINGSTVTQPHYTVKFHKPSNYPFQVPGIEIQSQLPNYIKREIMVRLVNYLVDNQYLGTPMIYMMIDWMDENWNKIKNDPGPLYIEPTKRIEVQERLKRKVSKRTGINPELVKKHHQKSLNDSNYEKMLNIRSRLPAWSKQQAIKELVNNNQVILVTGETGSGKSTQVVQFLTDLMYEQGDFESTIYVTQPRRISVLGLSDRVSEERCGKVGEEVGYIIRGDSSTSNCTRITFVTTGVLIRMISEPESLKNVKYLMVDEVHERSVDSDFLLMLLKQIIKTANKDLKIILMSATIDKSIFNTFFGKTIGHVHIEGRTFPIDDYYLDDIIELTNFEMMINGVMAKPRIDSQFFKSGQINYDLVVTLVEHLNDEETILIFMPGVYEINMLVNKLNHINGNRKVLPLHSGLNPQDQRKIFNLGKKVVVSTNIAETSITIPDCTAVIDLGRVKVMDYTSSTASTKLIETWCSKSESLQRRGRAGRVKHGKCFKLYSRETYESFNNLVIPEITRTNVDNLYLTVKSMGINNVEKFLRSGIDAPSASNLEISKNTLEFMGCLKNGKLTSLGKVMSLMPTDLSQGKLIIYGAIFGCVENCLIVAAVTSLGSPFIKSPDRDIRLKNKVILANYAKGNGDLIGYVNLFKAMKTTKTSSSKFIKDNNLSFNIVKEIMSNVSQLKGILKDLNFTMNDRNKDNLEVLKAIITASYYPKVAKVVYPDTKYVATSSGSLEVDADARLTKYFIPSSDKPTRAFIHPSSTMFKSDNTGGMEYDENDDGKPDITPVVEKLAAKPPFMVYGSSHETTKLFINELTPTTCAAMIVFGNDMIFDVSSMKSPGVIVDGWTIRTWCKNAVVAKIARFLVEKGIEAALNGQDVEILKVVEKLF